MSIQIMINDISRCMDVWMVNFIGFMVNYVQSLVNVVKILHVQISLMLIRILISHKKCTKNNK